MLPEGWLRAWRSPGVPWDPAGAYNDGPYPAPPPEVTCHSWDRPEWWLYADVLINFDLLLRVCSPRGGPIHSESSGKFLGENRGEWKANRSDQIGIRKNAK